MAASVTIRCSSIFASPKISIQAGFQAVVVFPHKSFAAALHMFHHVKDVFRFFENVGLQALPFVFPHGKKRIHRPFQYGHKIRKELFFILRGFDHR
mgnify:CR=1 FL=1